MIIIGIHDLTGWWSFAIGVQLVVAVGLFLWNKTKNSSLNRVASEEMKLAKALAAWNPQPLVEENVRLELPPLMGKLNENILNMGATNFLSFDRNEKVNESALNSLRKYGVGSCGPRGFYGTIDVHLELEERLAKFMNVEETCVYSYGFSTIASAIPAYAKRNDIIFADESVWFAVQKGIDASRSTSVYYFRHNDMTHLEEMLKEAQQKKKLNSKRRAFLIAEGLYYNTGTICPLKRLVELARNYKLRIILDESLSIGVLGKTGRGLTELYNIPVEEIDLIVGSLEHSFGSVGGFCAGSHFIVEHQRLSGLGYCFSASLPPLLTQAAITGLDILEENPDILRELEENSKKLHVALNKLKHYRVSGHELSPIKHIYLTADITDRLKQSYLEAISTYCMGKGIAFSVASYLMDNEVKRPEPSIRIASNRSNGPGLLSLNDETIRLACTLLDEAYTAVRPQTDIQKKEVN